MIDEPKDEKAGTEVTRKPPSQPIKGQRPGSSDLLKQGNKDQAGKKNVQQNNAENQSQAQANTSAWQKVKASFSSSVGQIVFGMEDGTVSIFGLVFGMAATAPNSHAVMIAGATGAAAAAVSMMAGAYLDVESTKAKAKAQIAEERKEIQNKPEEEQQEIHDRLKGAGFNEQETNQMLKALTG